MKKILILLAALLVASAAYAENEIGMYMVATGGEEADACYSGPAGQWTAYVTLSDPYNQNLDAPISSVGGFEFALAWPAGLFVTPTIHASATNFQSSPNFYCGANIPVVGGECLLITIAFGSFTTDPGSVFISPVSDENTHSIPGSIAITDLNDNYSISEAYPTSGSFEDAIYGLWTCPVPNEDVSFGGVKALFQ